MLNFNKNKCCCFFTALSGFGRHVEKVNSSCEIQETKFWKTEEIVDRQNRR